MARWLAVALLAVVATGCGFHLRTWDLETSLESVYVVSSDRNPLAEPLRRALRQAGVAEAATASEAEVVVNLLDERRERRSVSVSSQARAAEYETTLAVLYQVSDGAGNELIPAQWVQQDRVYRVDRDNIVGSSEEQALLEREMQSDLIQQILRALNAVAAENDPAAGSVPDDAAAEPVPTEDAGADPAG